MFVSVQWLSCQICNQWIACQVWVWNLLLRQRCFLEQESTLDSYSTG